MVTRLYFHAADSTIPGTLPAIEQAIISAEFRSDDQTVNRSMNTTIGVSQTLVSTLQLSVSLGTHNYYMTRFVSPLLNQSSISSGVWTYAFATLESISGNNNFPVSGTDKPVHVNCYVWKPSDGTKYGTILDGNTATTIDEGSANVEHYHIVDFTGSTVSGITPTDAVIILEIWFVVSTPNLSGSTITNSFYFDGTTVSIENATSSNAASYLETNQTLYFIEGAFIQIAQPTQTVSVSESIARTVTRQTRNMSLFDSVSITDSIADHASPQPRHIEKTLANENVSISGTVGFTITRNTPLNVVRVMPGQEIVISDFASCQATSGTIIYTGDPSYMSTTPT